MVSSQKQVFSHLTGPDSWLAAYHCLCTYLCHCLFFVFVIVFVTDYVITNHLTGLDTWLVACVARLPAAKTTQASKRKNQIG